MVLKVKVIISKRAYLLGVLYDLYHVPSLIENDHLYVLNVGELSKFFYVGMMFDKYSLWRKAFETVIGLTSDYESEKYLEILDDIDIYRWDLLKAELELLASKLITNIYPNIKSKLLEAFKNILGIEKVFKKSFIIIGVNTFKGLFGSLPVYNGEEYAVATTITNLNVKPEEILDLTIHELLHGLIRVNNIPIPEQYEEEFIDILTPEGFLSKHLGLSKTVKSSESPLYPIVKAYFEEKQFERGVSLIGYLKNRLNQTYHL